MFAKLPKSLTTVTTFSKLLAMLLFILFPFFGFYVGMKYQENLDNTVLKNELAKQNELLINPEVTYPPLKLQNTSHWKIYTNATYNFSVKYPPDYKDFKDVFGYVDDKKDMKFIYSPDIEVNQLAGMVIKGLEIAIFVTSQKDPQDKNRDDSLTHGLPVPFMIENYVHERGADRPYIDSYIRLPNSTNYLVISCRGDILGCKAVTPSVLSTVSIPSK